MTMKTAMWLWRRRAMTTERLEAISCLDYMQHDGSCHRHFFRHPQPHASRDQA